ncbi:condensation domain-containing protein [Pseudomonas aeruginosa]|nr:condensation domain-containing protein [Pseudomonas aeruginosa]
MLEQPPFHLRLIRLGEARYWFMMSNHHILIDAWCRGLLMNDAFEIYGALGEGRRRTCRRRRATATTSPGCNARTWSNRVAGSESLRGFERPTLVPSDRPFLREHAGESGGMIVGDRYASGRRRRRAPARTGAALPTHRQHLRPGRLALTLRRFSGERDVLFGVTVAGRPVGMPGNAAHIGLFINSIPLRVQMPAAGAALHGARNG